MCSHSRRRAWLRLCTLLLSVSGVVACSGGGGGGDGPAPIVYTGSTAHAAITTLNAAALAGGAYLTSASGAATSISGAQTTAAPSPHGSRALLVAEALKKSVSRLDFTMVPAMASGAIVRDSGSFIGTCPGREGSVSYDIALDDVTGDFTGTLNYNNLCIDDFTMSTSDDVTLSGLINISGNIDLPSYPSVVFTRLSMETSVLSIRTINDSFGTAGTIDFTNIVANVSQQITESLRFKTPDGTVFQNENFVMQAAYGASATTITIISGRYYDPAEGYVDVSGLVNFVVNLDSLYPQSGQLRILGAASSRAELTVNIDEQTFDLDVYPDGSTLTEINGNRWDAL